MGNHRSAVYRIARKRKLQIVLLSILELSVAAGSTSAAPIVIGTGSGTAFEIVDNLVLAAQADLDFSIQQTSTYDATFFSQIDVFLFGNAQGANHVSLGATARNNLLNFVTGGGHAYLGLDAFAPNDGAAIAALFGFTISNRQSITEFGAIATPLHPIASGPYQPAADFRVSFSGEITGSLPTGGSILGVGATSNRDLLAYLAADALAPGSGTVYLYSDEVPLLGISSDHLRLFENSLVDMGAMPIPEPSTGLLMSVGLALIGLQRRHIE